MLDRFGTPQDVGWAIVFLASDEAAWITGTDLIIDGGATAW
jgi:NAD(P)-dependent dehydrogenase (short-subunit alcohol dehydrogenase family)